MVLPTTNNTHPAFEAFFETWLITLENYHRQLLHLIENCDGEDHEHRCKTLVGQVMVHYSQYFEYKARVVCENVFLVISPTWFSSVERVYMWLGGFRPGLAYRLVVNNILNLADDQTERINRLMTEFKDEEKELSDELTRLQEAMTSPMMVELARHLGRLSNGMGHSMESAVDRLKASMEALVMCADFLRMKTGVKGWRYSSRAKP